MPSQYLLLARDTLGHVSKFVVYAPVKAQISRISSNNPIYTLKHREHVYNRDVLHMSGVCVKPHCLDIVH